MVPGPPDLSALETSALLIVNTRRPFLLSEMAFVPFAEADYGRISMLSCAMQETKVLDQENSSF